MSRIGRFKTEIVSVKEGVLKRAMEVVAERNNLKLTDCVKDFYGRRTPCMAFDVGSRFGASGIGAVVNTKGGLEFLYDKSALGDRAGHLEREIVTTYTSLVAALTLQAMGFEVSTSEDQMGTLIVGRST